MSILYIFLGIVVFIAVGVILLCIHHGLVARDIYPKGTIVHVGIIKLNSELKGGITIVLTEAGTGEQVFDLIQRRKENLHPEGSVTSSLTIIKPGSL